MCTFTPSSMLIVLCNVYTQLLYTNAVCVKILYNIFKKGLEIEKSLCVF